MEVTYDRTSELKAFDELKIGVKGLVDAGISQIPRIFHHSLTTVTNPKPSSTVMTKIPIIDLGGGVFDSTVTRESVIEMIRDAVERFGFFQVINHGIPIDVMEKMKDGIREFHEQDSEVRKKFYSRDIIKKVKYNSNFDLYSSPSANWRDTLACFMFPDVPKTEDLPEICRYELQILLFLIYRRRRKRRLKIHVIGLNVLGISCWIIRSE